MKQDFFMRILSAKIGLSHKIREGYYLNRGFTMASQEGYLLAGGAAELERLTLQARVWEPASSEMLDEIGLKPEADCVDLGCGPMGILPVLRRRIGSSGTVVGIDYDPKLIVAAKLVLAEQQVRDVELLELDCYKTGLADNRFDFTHVRFVFAPVGRDEELLREMLRLTKPGGVIAIQEPDALAWNCFPLHPSWLRLKEAILEAFRLGGGDFNAGQRTFGMLHRAGLKDIRIRSAVLSLQNQHPYMRLPLQFANSLRERILKNGILYEDEFKSLCKDYEELIAQPETSVTSFIVNQVWGRKA
jgi:SAM-dependent methyltransferase